MKTLLQYLREDVWRVRLRKLPPPRLFWTHVLRMILIAGRGFHNDHCGLRASALTLYTLLSIVPVLALAFGVAKGFKLDKLLEREIYNLFQVEAQLESATRAAAAQDGATSGGLWLAAPAPDVSDAANTGTAVAPGGVTALPQHDADNQYSSQIAAKLIDFSNRLLESTSGGLIAGVGVLILLFTVMQALGHIENSFNHIWGIEKSRPLWRKFTDYFFVVFITMTLFILSSGLTIWLQSQIIHAGEKHELLAAAGRPMLFLLRFTPVLMLLLLFSFLYTFMPNTAVRPNSGLIGGLVAAVLYQAAQLAYIKFQLFAAKYGAVYGSFAALPLFIIWLQASWLIVLLGAEVTYAHQNAELYDFEPDCRKVSHQFRRRVILRLAQLCAGRFQAGLEPLSAEQLAHEIEAPVRLINTLLHELVQCGVLAEVNPPTPGPPVYQPARPPETLTLQSVIEAWENLGTGEIPLSDAPEWKAIGEKLSTLQSNFKASKENISLPEIR